MRTFLMELHVQLVAAPVLAHCAARLRQMLAILERAAVQTAHTCSLVHLLHSSALTELLFFLAQQSQEKCKAAPLQVLSYQT
jgi:hypothetical protein